MTDAAQPDTTRQGPSLGDMLATDIPFEVLVQLTIDPVRLSREIQVRQLVGSFNMDTMIDRLVTIAAVRLWPDIFLPTPGPELVEAVVVHELPTDGPF